MTAEQFPTQDRRGAEDENRLESQNVTTESIARVSDAGGQGGGAEAKS
jgi:hypothetical protein